jgi:sortase A
MINMKNKKERYAGVVLIFIGLVLVIAGALLAGWHYWNTSQIRQNTQNILSQMDQIIQGDSGEADTLDQKLKTLYKTHPDVSMPVASIDGESFVGRLDFLDSGLSLPVLNTKSVDDSGTLPCRYEGTAYQDNLVIRIPTGTSEIGNLDTLGTGDRISFTDLDGHSFIYEVASVEEAETESEEALQEEDWDLTVYGTIFGGKYPLAVHCNRIQDNSETLGAFLSTE